MLLVVFCTPAPPIILCVCVASLSLASMHPFSHSSLYFDPPLAFNSFFFFATPFKIGLLGQDSVSIGTNEDAIGSLAHVFDKSYEEILYIYHDNVLHLFLQSDEYREFKSQQAAANAKRRRSRSLSKSLIPSNIFGVGRRESVEEEPEH